MASALANEDPTLWGPQAQPKAARRLAWVSLPHTSRPLLATIDALWAELHSEVIDRVVLAGMGGSSLAPEVICATSRVPLTVLDTTDPGEVADALAGDLERTVLVVSSKSGSTVETDSHRRVFAAAFAAAGLDPAAHLVVVTDPGSPLQRIAEAEGYRAVITAEPNVGGRYSALTAFGLVPAGLARADITNLLDDAERRPTCWPPTTRRTRHCGWPPRWRSGMPPVPRRSCSPTPAPGSSVSPTGPSSSSPSPPARTAPACCRWWCRTRPRRASPTPDRTLPRVADRPGWRQAAAVAVSGTLGGQMLLWEYAIAVVGRLLGINPFDQPDVEAAKAAARAQLDALHKPAARPARGVRRG